MELVPFTKYCDLWVLTQFIFYFLYQPLVAESWFVITSSPNDAEVLFRSEGDLPSRGLHESNIMWIYRKINFPPPMFFS